MYLGVGGLRYKYKPSRRSSQLQKRYCSNMKTGAGTCDTLLPLPKDQMAERYKSMNLFQATGKFFDEYIPHHQRSQSNDIPRQTQAISFSNSPHLHASVDVALSMQFR